MRLAVAAALVALGLCRAAFAQCSDLAPLERLLGDAKTAQAHGACLASDVAALPPAPYNRQPPPQEPSMTVRVTARGFVGATGEPVADLHAAIRANPNISWERTHANAAAHGVAIEAEAAAPARLVKEALAVLADEHVKQVWLIFKPANAVAAPPPHALDHEFGGKGQEAVMRAVGVLRREVAPCPAVQRIFGRMGGQLLDGKMDLMIKDSVGALKECDCKMKPATLAALWWNLALKNLGVAVPVDPARALPWGRGTWGEATPAVLAALKP
jgi:hypothetical protein